MFMAKKAKNILMRYMDNTKRNLLSSEDIAYAKKHGAILEDLPLTYAEAIRSLTQVLKTCLLARLLILFYIVYLLAIWSIDMF